MVKMLQRFLAFWARKIIDKYKPQVVGVTGSIGKTSTKEAIYAVLKQKYRVRQNIKNYNNEIGVPLTVIGDRSRGKSILGWLKVFFKAIYLTVIYDKNYPQVLVLEMGADHPGDISYLVNLVACDVGVVTKVAPVHLEFFETVEKIAKEKSQMVVGLKKEGVAILNFDDDLVKEMKKNTKAKVISYGYSNEADIRAIDIENQGEGLNIKGLKFKLYYRGSVVPMQLPNVLGAHQLYAAMAATAVGVAFGLNLVEISQGLKNYKSPKGRMNLIVGKNNSLIIDDTYNSSPQAATAALESVAKLKFEKINKKIAILGDMLELGQISEQAHFDLGKKVAKLGFDMGIFVGQYREKMAQGAHSFGLENTLLFENSEQASRQLSNGVDANDVILVKGSQGVRMEKIVKALMAEPEKAKDLLVRQSDDWQGK